MLKALVYNDVGVSKESVKHTLRFLNYFFSDVVCITARDIVENNILDKAELLVFPGGRDLQYLRLLRGNGCEKIRKFVENGGIYLGICAGAYFGSSQIEFAKGCAMEVCGTRELGFYKSRAVGPILAPYNYENDSGSRAANVIVGTDELFLYCNGGCAFPEARGFQNVRIIGTLKERNLPVIIETEIGDGKAILSGVHFEVDPNFLKKNTFHSMISPSLIKSNAKRLSFARKLLRKRKHAKI